MTVLCFGQIIGLISIQVSFGRNGRTSTFAQTGDKVSNFTSKSGIFKFLLACKLRLFRIIRLAKKAEKS